MTYGDQGQNRASVSSLYPAAFGSAKPCTYLIAETVAWKSLWAFAMYSH